jgi:hypothetical protein
LIHPFFGFRGLDSLNASTDRNTRLERVWLFPGIFRSAPNRVTGPNIGSIKIDPFLDPLRGNPRFEAFVQKVFAPKKAEADSRRSLP